MCIYIYTVYIEVPSVKVHTTLDGKGSGLPDDLC